MGAEHVDVDSRTLGSAEARWPDLLRALDRALLLASVSVGVAGLGACAVGAGVWHLGPIAIGLRRPLRAVAVAVALLLVRAAIQDRRGRRAAAATVALLSTLLAALALDSRPSIVGDGQEYLAMAWNLGHARTPAPSRAERAEVEQLASLKQGELSTGREALLGADGGQDFHHFWLYSLLVAPFIPAVIAAGGNALQAFTLANALLLLAAAAVLHRRLGAGGVAILLGGPLLWWLDKPHPEVFLVAVLAMALAMANRHPSAALVLAGLAAAQNPALGSTLLIGTAWAVGRSGPRPRVAALALAWGLACCNPLYYLHRLGEPLPLRETVLPHVPGLAELSAVVIDPNLGLLPAWPALAIVFALAGVALLTRSRRGEPVPGRELAALLVAALALLVAFTQPGNINHGGTRGMSRYALWLAPFAVPALAVLRRSARGRLALPALAGLSLLSTFDDYLPNRPQRYLEPTPLARWLWTRHPGFDRPLPEVFAERACGYPPLGTVPAALPGCELALVQGDGSPRGRWPLSCAPIEKPQPCREPGVLCYAAAGPAGTTFSRAPDQPTFREPERARWSWTGTPEPELLAALKHVPWQDLGLVAPADEGVFLAERRGGGKHQIRTTTACYLAWFDAIRRRNAWVTPIVRVPSLALVIDPETGEELSRTRLAVVDRRRVELPSRAPLLLVVLDVRSSFRDAP